MLSEAHYRTVLNFFYFLLLDEAMALTASLKAIQKVQKQVDKRPEPDVDAIMISSMVSVFNKYMSHKNLILTAPPKSDWKVPRIDYLVAWKEYMRKAESQSSVALVLHYILGYKTSTMAEAMKVPEGTIAFRLGRGLESLAQSSILQTLVKR